MKGEIEMLVTKKLEIKVNIVDSIMGSGKTSWAIQYMNSSPANKKFIYITPFLNEVDRVIKSTKRKFIQPDNNKGETKLEVLKQLIISGENIVSTHALFKRLDNTLIDLISMKEYTLILDEVMDVINQVNISKDDVKLLMTATTLKGNPIITVDSTGFVKWNEDEYIHGNFEYIRNLARTNNLYIFDNSIMYWLLPISAFKAFREVYVLTYMFKGQVQCYYFDLFKVNYVFYSVVCNDGNYQLSDYVLPKEEDKKHLKSLIRIYYPSRNDKNDLNEIGEKRSAFSVSHLKEFTMDSKNRTALKNNGFNFFYNKCKVPSNEVMWTTFKNHEKQLRPKNLGKQFVEVTARATNDYADKSTCIYFANRYMNPITKKFFTSKGVHVDEELFALSELLQWLFRSRIRKGESINLYLPSKRMRTLLEKYLNNDL